MDFLRIDHRPRQPSLQHETVLERTHEEGIYTQQSNRIRNLFAWGSLIRLTFWDGCKKVETEIEDARRERVCGDWVGR